MINYNEHTQKWSASVCMRHPVTKSPTSMRRDNLSNERQAVLVERQLREALISKFKIVIEPTWSRVFEEYCQEIKTREMSEKSKRTYVGCLKAAIGSDWDTKFVKDISAEEIKHIIKYKHQHYSESHKKNMRKFLNSVFEFALLKKYVDFNPTPKMKFKIGQKIETTLNHKQCSELLKKAFEQNHEFYSIWFVALHTGMRNGELYMLKWKNVDFERRIIKVCGSWGKLTGYIDYTKTGHDRLVPLNEQLYEFLIREKETSDADFVLPRLKKWENGEQSRILKDFLRQNSLPEMRFHDCRATCATLMLSKGVPLAAVMNILGWKQLKTANVYYRKSAVDIATATSGLIF